MRDASSRLHERPASIFCEIVGGSSVRSVISDAHVAGNDGLKCIPLSGGVKVVRLRSPKKEASSRRMTPPSLSKKSFRQAAALFETSKKFQKVV